jgi:hypothetical protein
MLRVPDDAFRTPPWMSAGDGGGPSGQQDDEGGGKVPANEAKQSAEGAARKQQCAIGAVTRRARGALPPHPRTAAGFVLPDGCTSQEAEAGQMLQVRRVE